MLARGGGVLASAGGVLASAGGVLASAGGMPGEAPRAARQREGRPAPGPLLASGLVSRPR